MNKEQIVKDNEETFQNAWDKYWHTDTTAHTSAFYKKQWDTMWDCVYKACLYEGKTKCYGLRVPDLESKVMDAVILIMENIRRGVHPKKLSSYVYLYMIGQVWNLKYQRTEREVSYEGMFDNYIYNEDEYKINKKMLAYVEDLEGQTTLCDGMF